MKITAIMMLLMWSPGPPQVGSLEKQALATVQRMMVSRLDAELPRYAFVTWFNRVIGPDAGVVWQLTECGEAIGQQDGAERDLIACTQANALLPDGRKVVVAISVGTFKKGIYGEPAFYSAVIEQDDRFYEVRRLRDLPEILHSPRVTPSRLPIVVANFKVVKPTFNAGYMPASSAPPYPFPGPPATPLKLLPEMNNPRAPAQLTELEKPQKIPEGLVRGQPIVKVNPVFPTNTRTLSSFFHSVEVMVVVSEQGYVIDAQIIRAHPILHKAVLEAARKWIFEPTTLNGKRIKVKNILNFVYNTGSR